jgi:hypothetical protein
MESCKDIFLCSAAKAIRVESGTGGVQNGTLQITIRVRATQFHDVEILDATFWLTGLRIDGQERSVFLPFMVNACKTGKIKAGQTAELFGVCYLPSVLSSACAHPAKVEARLQDQAHAVLGFPYQQRVTISSGNQSPVFGQPPSLLISC